MYRQLAFLSCIVTSLLAFTTRADAKSTYKVGAASVAITPKVAPDAPPVWLAGYGMGRQAETVHDDIYARAKNAGAVGGKISGAGGGGFMILFVPPDARFKVREALGDFLHVPFRFDNNGSQIVFYDPDMDDYAASVRDRSGRTFRSFSEL